MAIWLRAIANAAKAGNAQTGDTPGEGIRQQVFDAQNRRKICLIRTVLQQKVVRPVVTQAQLIERVGAKGVGKATTQAVVISSVLILIWDYFITSVFI